MDLRISLSPTGGLRLHVPDAKRSLDIPITTDKKVIQRTGYCSECKKMHTEIEEESVISPALRIIARILRNADEYRGTPERGHIGAFPTQAVLDAWLRADAQRKIEDEKARWAAKGVDIEALEFKL